jgi:hypothetical protein
MKVEAPAPVVPDAAVDPVLALGELDEGLLLDADDPVVAAPDDEPIVAFVRMK